MFTVAPVATRRSGFLPDILLQIIVGYGKPTYENSPYPNGEHILVEPELTLVAYM